MNNISEILDILTDRKFHSGSSLANRFSVTHTTIAAWIQKLGNYGLTINRVKGKGYKLVDPISLLVHSEVMAYLNEDSVHLLSRLEIELETQSTNLQATKSEYKNEHWSVFTSEYQSAGKGRRGKQWVSALGSNLLFSIASKRHWTSDVLYLAPLMSGYAVVSTLKKVFNVDAMIKWPNDIYVNGNKIAGVLCELQGSPLDDALLVIGVGLNVHSYPEVVSIPATSLSEVLNQEVNRNQLLGEMLNELIALFSSIEVQGIQKFLLDWRQYDFLTGKDINVQLGDKEYQGQAMGVDVKGELLVRLNTGSVRVFNGGEVSVRW